MAQCRKRRYTIVRKNRNTEIVLEFEMSTIGEPNVKMLNEIKKDRNVNRRIKILNISFSMIYLMHILVNYIDIS